VIIDTNVHIGVWPFRRPPWFETGEIVKKLRSVGITEAWTGSFEGMLHKDLAGVNTRLAEECKRFPSFLIPFGSVNPRLPDWEEDLRRCHEQHRMSGIRLYPNYHGYRLDDPAFGRLLEGAAERRLVVQIAVRMEDERTHHPLMQVPAVDLNPLPAVLARSPNVRVQILNAAFNPRDETPLVLARTSKVWFDFANVESVGGLAKMLQRFGPERVVFGTHFPLFYPESALFKVRESALKDEELKAIEQSNARTLVPRS
jgi:predicted TIM-barrel fold metal-dependent hydrolase